MSVEQHERIDTLVQYGKSAVGVDADFQLNVDTYPQPLDVRVWKPDDIHALHMCLCVWQQFVQSSADSKCAVDNTAADAVVDLASPADDAEIVFSGNAGFCTQPHVDSYPDFFVWTIDSDDDDDLVTQRGKKAVAARQAALMAAENFDSEMYHPSLSVLGQCSSSSNDGPPPMGANTATAARAAATAAYLQK